MTTVTRRITGLASGGQTSRVSGTASGGSTVRVSESSSLADLLLLEGDEAGHLLLEGDFQIFGHSRLQLEGDANDPGGSFTRRVTL